MGKELSGIFMLPDSTVKPPLKVADALTVNNRLEFAPMVVSRTIDTSPAETVIPFENVCNSDHVFASVKYELVD